MNARNCLAIVLAAGEGTRMRSSRPKVLHTVAGRTLLANVLAALKAAGGTATAVVVGPDRDDVAAEARAQMPGAEIFVQRERLGTAHAVLAARAALEKGADDVLVIFGDTPLIKPQTLAKLRAGADRRRQRRRAGVQARRSDRLRAAGDEWLRTHGHRRARRRDRSAARALRSATAA